MKTCVILLKMRNVSEKKIVEKIKTHFIFSNFYPTFLPLSDNVDKHGTAGEATDGCIMRLVRFACWITKATDTHTQNM